MLIKKRDVWQSLTGELRMKYANTSKTLSSRREHYTSTTKRLSNVSPQCQGHQKKEKKFSPRAQTVKTPVFNDSETDYLPSNLDDGISVSDENEQQQQTSRRSLFNTCPKQLEEREIKVRYYIFFTFSLYN